MRPRINYHAMCLLLLMTTSLKASLEDIAKVGVPILGAIIERMFLRPQPVAEEEVRLEDLEDVPVQMRWQEARLENLEDVPVRMDQSPLGTSPQDLDKQFEISDEDYRQAAEISKDAYGQLREILNRKYTDEEFAAFVLEKYILELKFCAGKAIALYHAIHNGKSLEAGSLVYEEVDYLRKSLTKSSEDLWIKHASEREKAPEYIPPVRNPKTSEEEDDLSSTLEDLNLQEYSVPPRPRENDSLMQFDLEID